MRNASHYFGLVQCTAALIREVTISAVPGKDVSMCWCYFIYNLLVGSFQYKLQHIPWSFGSKLKQSCISYSGTLQDSAVQPLYSLSWSTTYFGENCFVLFFFLYFSFRSIHLCRLVKSIRVRLTSCFSAHASMLHLQWGSNTAQCSLGHCQLIPWRADQPMHSKNLR